jgi:hypothetical protein
LNPAGSDSRILRDSFFNNFHPTPIEMVYCRLHIPRFQYAGLAFLVLFICLGTGLRNAYADELILTNGDRISGSLISFNQKAVRISTSYSGILEIHREHIQQLTTENPMIVELVSGERVIGRIGSDGEQTIIVHSSRLGDRILSLSTIASMKVYLPEQDSLSAQLQDIRGMGPKDSSASEKTSEEAPETGSQPKPIGSKPEDEEDIRKIFLRQTTVLLRPGVKEVDVELDYLSTRVSATIFDTRFRQFLLPLSFRFGLADGLEGSVSIAPTYLKREISFAGESVTQDETGIGDTLIGVNYEIFRETARWPDVTAVLRVQAPTGDVPNAEGLSTGSGNWAGAFGFQFTKTTDPIVLFWGLLYTHAWSASYFFNDAVYDVQPGDSIDYNFGFGFAVNQDVSLSAEVLGGYQWDTELDGQKLSGSSREPVSLRGALTYRISRNSYLEPSLRMGLNNEAPDFVIGVAATRRFGKE